MCIGARANKQLLAARAAGLADHDRCAAAAIEDVRHVHDMRTDGLLLGLTAMEPAVRLAVVQGGAA